MLSREFEDWQFWPKYASAFPLEILATFRDQMVGKHLSKKVMRNHAFNPKIWPKMWPGWPKKRSYKSLKFEKKQPLFKCSSFCWIKWPWNAPNCFQRPQNWYLSPSVDCTIRTQWLVMMNERTSGGKFLKKMVLNLFCNGWFGCWLGRPNFFYFPPSKWKMDAI